MSVNKLFEQKYYNNIRTISGTGGVIYPDDIVLLCDTSLGAVTVNLLDIPVDNTVTPPKGKWSTLYKLYIVDKSGNASVNNITVNAPAGVLINSVSSFVINQNNASLMVRVGSNTDYIGSYSAGSGSGMVAGHIIQDEGTSLTQRPKLNFVGSGVTATDDALNNATVVTINGSGGLVYLTNAQMRALVTAGTVIEGQFYCITDCANANPPVGVVVQGVNIKGATTVQGSGLYFNADYQKNGDYSGVAGYVAPQLGIWSSIVVPVVVGNVVVYDNHHYKNKTGVWGNPPTADAVNWELLPYSLTNGYIYEVDFVKYNLTKNIVIYRADKRGNEVDYYYVDVPT